MLELMPVIVAASRIVQINYSKAEDSQSNNSVFCIVTFKDIECLSLEWWAVQKQAMSMHGLSSTQGQSESTSLTCSFSGFLPPSVPGLSPTNGKRSTHGWIVPKVSRGGNILEPDVCITSHLQNPIEKAINISKTSS